MVQKIINIRTNSNIQVKKTEKWLQVMSNQWLSSQLIEVYLSIWTKRTPHQCIKSNNTTPQWRKKQYRTKPLVYIKRREKKRCIQWLQVKKWPKIILFSMNKLEETELREGRVYYYYYCYYYYYFLKKKHIVI